MKKVFRCARMVILLFVLIGHQAYSLEHTAGNVRENFFIENKGQWPEEVLFMTRMKGCRAWITRTGISYEFYQQKKSGRNAGPPFADPYAVSDDILEGHVIRFQYNHSREQVTATGSGKRPGSYNFFIGNDPGRWSPLCGLYDEVMIQGLYPGITQRYYFDRGRLRHDYLIGENANPDQLSFTILGASGSRVSQQGDLVFESRFGSCKQAELFAYQQAGQEKLPVPCHFIQTAPNTFSFDLPEYDRSLALVIDPVLEWLGYAGGTGPNFVYDEEIVFSTDNYLGEVYTCGTTSAMDFPVTTGPFNQYNGGNLDGFVTKFSDDGQVLYYSTFIGGSGTDEIKSMRYNVNNGLLFAGGTDSPDFPLQSPFDPSLNDGTNLLATDCILGSLNDTGSVLLYSSYFGGRSDDYLFYKGNPQSVFSSNSLRRGNGNKIFLVGSTRSTDFPIINGFSSQLNNGGADTTRYDSFLACFNTSGSVLTYSTFLGGGGDDLANSLVLSQPYAYVTGSTRSVNFPVTPQAMQSTKGSLEDAFLARINITLSGSASLEYSTYFGGNGADIGTSLCKFSPDTIYMLMSTTSGNLPVLSSWSYTFTANGTQTYDQTYSGQEDCYIARIAFPAGPPPSLLHSTYFGSGNTDVPNSIITDKYGNLWFVGEVFTGLGLQFPLTNDAYDYVTNGAHDCFVSSMTAGLDKLRYSTFLGGDDFDHAFSVLVTPEDELFMSGFTMESAGINLLPVGPVFDTILSGQEGFVAKFNICNTPRPTVTSPLQACIGSPFTISAGPGDSMVIFKSGLAVYGDTTTAYTIGSFQATDTGIYKLVIYDYSACTDTLYATISAYPELTCSITVNDDTLCEGQLLNLNSTHNNTSGPYTFDWEKNNSFPAIDTLTTGNPPAMVTDAGYSGTYMLQVIDGNGCKAVDSVRIQVDQAPVDFIPLSSDSVCRNAIYQLCTDSAYAAYSYFWTGAVTGPVNSHCVTLLTDTGSAGNPYRSVITISQGSCSISDTFLLYVFDRPQPSFIGDTVVCEGSSISVQFSASGGSGGYQWQWTGPPANPGGTGAVIQLTNADTADSGTYLMTVTDQTGCQAQLAFILAVQPGPHINGITANPFAVCFGDSVAISSTVTPGQGPVTTFQWMTDNQNFTGINLGSFAVDTLSPGSHALSLVVTDGNGCLDSLTLPLGVVVHALPDTTSLLIPDLSLACKGSQNISLSAGCDSAAHWTYLWTGENLGNNIDSTACSIVLDISGSSPDPFYVSLVIMDENGCRIQKTFEVGLSGTISSQGIVVKKKKPAAADAILMVLDNTAATYQWGYDLQDPNRSSIVQPGERFQTLYLPVDNTDTLDYWVELTRDDCRTRIYYSGAYADGKPHVVTEQDAELGFMVTPNPVHGTATLLLTGIYTGEITIRLMNGFGQELVSAIVSKTSPILSFPINQYPYSAGIYFIRVTPESGNPMFGKIEITR